MLKKFKEYVDKFNSEEAIKYKYNHSLRVMDLSEKISRSLNLTEEEINLSKVIGLLHDYSRFKQWNEFSTFDDFKTFDHGDEAIKILFEERQIEQYNLEKKYYPIIKDAIKNHNKYKIENVQNNSLIFCKIIRDADKLDIITEFTKSLFNKTNNNFIHEEVKRQFFNHESVICLKGSTDADRLIIKLALIYDLNYSYSFKYLVDNNIINKIKEQIDIDIFNIYFNEIEKYIEKRLMED